MRRSALLPTLALMLAAVSTSAAPLPLPEVAVTTCGQIVPRKTLGYLTGDLDCSGYTAGGADIIDEGAAVTVGYKSKLDLRGFTLTGGIHGVLCDNLRSEAKRKAVCEVFNGTITGAVQRGVGGIKLYVHDLTATSNGVGIYHYGNKGRVEDVVVTGNVDDGIRIGKARVARATITGNGGNGIVDPIARNARVVARDSTITGNGTGAFCAANPGDCFDVNSSRRPTLENVVCGTSGGSSAYAPPTWGVCSLD
jgi:hypothetical protein